MEAVRKECANYDLKNIFNVGETGLFLKLLPKRSYFPAYESLKTSRGTKGMKANKLRERVSTALMRVDVVHSDFHRTRTGSHTKVNRIKVGLQLHLARSILRSGVGR